MLTRAGIDATAPSIARAGNCEMRTVRDGKLAAVEVYCGWNLPHWARS